MSPKDPLTDWRKQITTDTVSVPKGTMTRDSLSIVQILLAANPGLEIYRIIRFVRFHINRGGRKLANRTEIERALDLLIQINRSK